MLTMTFLFVKRCLVPMAGRPQAPSSAKPPPPLHSKPPWVVCFKTMNCLHFAPTRNKGRSHTPTLYAERSKSSANAILQTASNAPFSTPVTGPVTTLPSPGESSVVIWIRK